MMYKSVKKYFGEVKYLFNSVFSTIKNKEFDNTNARPFEEIPGPKGLPLLGTFHKYLPIIGEYDNERLHISGANKFACYGPLVKETIVGQTIVWVFQPEDIAKVFKSEYGKIPARRSHLALYKYRIDRKSIYKTGGLLPTNGEEWLRIRKEFQKSLSKPKEVIMYLNGTNSVMEQFIKLSKDNDHEDLLPLLSRLYLELICMVAFDEKMDSFSEEEMRKDSKSSKLIDSALVTNSASLRLDGMLRLWRFFDTPLYKTLCRAQEFMESIAVDMVYKKKKKLSSLSSDHKLSLLETYLLNPALDEKDVVGMACDMLLAGVDTTTYSTSFALYHLATNPKAQETLHQEASTLLPNENDPVTAEVLKKANYVKVVLKETLRLNPISVGIGRILQTDVVLSGYKVPKGTNVVTQNQVICRSIEYFNDPDSFIPERWLKKEPSKYSSKEKPIHPYAVLPFGHGPRSCIARRLAEQNMQVFLLRICRDWKFTWRGGKLGCRSLLINKPDAPINSQGHEC